MLQVDGSKVHYPLPLNPVETGAFLMDKETMKRMVSRMSQTLTEIKQSPAASARQTAKEFFSKENLTHPVVEENLKLREKLRLLEETKSHRGGAAQVSLISAEADRVAQEFDDYKSETATQVSKLRSLKRDLVRQIEAARQEMAMSERPQSAYSQLSYREGHNEGYHQTMTSNFNGSSVSEIEELRRQLAESSVELEESRDLNKRRLALQQKQLEEYYETLTLYRADEKATRVRVNQLENELDHHLKRLDIICKSKGLPRPQRKASLTPQAKSSTYVSPYRRNTGSPAVPRSTGSSAKRPQPYTPPNRRAMQQ